MENSSLQNDGRLPVPTRLELSETNAYRVTDAEAVIGVLDYWRILGRHKGALMLGAILGALAGLLIAIPETPLYQARASVEIEGLNENFLNMKDFSPTSSHSGYYPEFDIQTQVKILESRSLLERVVKKMKLDRGAALSRDTGRLASWRSRLRFSTGKPETRDSAIAAAAGSVRVKSTNTNRIVEIFCDSTDAQLAADFANTLVNEFIEQNLEMRWKATERTGEWLNRQLDELKIKLEKSEDQLQGYARSAQLLFTGDKENVSEEKLRQLQTELTKAHADRVAKQSKYELASSEPVESLPDVLDDGYLTNYRIKVTDLRRQLAELTASLTPEHYKVRRIEVQITELESDLKKNRGNILSRIHNDFQAAVRREKLLTTDYNAQSTLVSEQAGKAIHYNILKREVNTNRQLYESMLQRVKEASVASAMRASAIHVVDPAAPPAAPYRPNLPRNSAMGLLAGVFVGAACLILKERSNRTLQQPGDTSTYLHLPELGVIPAAKIDRSTATQIRSRNVLSRATFKSANVTKDPLELVTWRHKPSLMADCFRATLTSIMFSETSEVHSRVFVLTSANPAEGKTTVVTNIAIALAEINRRVLLIDADMRRPRLHELFDLSNSVGLSDILKRSEPLNGHPLDVVVQGTEIPGLYALPSGPMDGSVSNLLHSPRLAELLAKLRTVFDAVLIDTPPMLHVPDARVLGRLSDAVILVFRAGETTRDTAAAARQRFHEDGTPVLGAILNGWNPAAHGYSYDYKYYDGYYSRNGNKSRRNGKSHAAAV